MYIKNIDITNFRAASSLRLDFKEGFNVLVGINGAGKSTVLDSIALSLSWLINRIQRPNTSGRHIPELSIKNNQNFSSLDITVNNLDYNYSWELVKLQRGMSSEQKSNLIDVSKLAAKIRDVKNVEHRLPVIIYYPVDRNVDTTSPEIKGKESIYILDVYDNALGGKANFQSFFEWFRLQDDIYNEQAQSRSKWLRQNNRWIKNRVNRLLKIFKNKIFRDNTEQVNKDEINWLLKSIEKEYIIEDPKYFFHELIKISNRLEIGIKRPIINNSLQDIEYLFHKLSIISETRVSNLKDIEQIPFFIIDRVIREFPQTEEMDKEINDFVAFVWETLIFSILLSFWWISDKGKRDIEKIFNELNPLKLNKSEQQDWQSLSEDLIKDIKTVLGNEFERIKSASMYKNKELNFVIEAIERFIPQYKNLRITRVPKPQMLIDKNDDILILDQLSDGEKNIIALVGDIARRLSIANPSSNNPLKENGIILIDEIDLHLHPSWQRMIVLKLSEVFPNCQFIVSTHSPQIISHIKPDYTYLLQNKQNTGIEAIKPNQSYGMNSDRILEDLMDVDARPPKAKKKLHLVFEAIQNNNLETAKTLINELQNEVGDFDELVKANVLIKRKKLIGK